MGEFKATKLYRDLSGLSTAQLDALFNSISDWINARELDDFNIAAGAITGANLRSDFVDEETLTLSPGSVSIGSLSASLWTDDVGAAKLTEGSLSIAKFASGAAAVGYGISEEYYAETVPVGSEIAQVTIDIKKAGCVLLEIIPGTTVPPSEQYSSYVGIGGTYGSSSQLNFMKDGVILVSMDTAAPQGYTLQSTECRAIYYESTPGTYTYGLSRVGPYSIELSGRLLVKEL